MSSDDPTQTDALTGGPDVPAATGEPTTTPRGLLLLTRVLAVLVFALLASQSVTAGGFLRAFYTDGGPVEWASLLHEVGASTAFGLLALEMMAVIVTPLRRRGRHVVTGLVLGVAVAASIGLGYVGGANVAVHVPVGVATIVLAWIHLTAAWHRQPKPSAD